MSGVLALMLVVLLCMSAAVAIHASGQQKSAALWGTLVFFTGLIGLVIYAISLASD
jgi:hypothetical protein